MGMFCFTRVRPNYIWYKHQVELLSGTHTSCWTTWDTHARLNDMGHTRQVWTIWDTHARLNYLGHICQAKYLGNMSGWIIWDTYVRSWANWTHISGWIILDKYFWDTYSGWTAWKPAFGCAIWDTHMRLNYLIACFRLNCLGCKRQVKLSSVWHTYHISELKLYNKIIYYSIL